MSRREAAEILGVHRDTVKNYERRGRLTPLRLGPQIIRYRLVEVLALMTEMPPKTETSQ